MMDNDKNSGERLTTERERPFYRDQEEIVELMHQLLEKTNELSQKLGEFSNYRHMIDDSFMAGQNLLLRRLFDAICYNANRKKYYKYCFLSRILFGEKRRVYQQKRDVIKEHLNNLQLYWKD